MTINANPLNVKINSDSVCNLTELEILQLAASTCTLENSRVYSVASINDLPVAADNTGRFIFVNSIQDYRYSDGLNWIRDYKSTVEFSLYPAVVWAWGFNSKGQLGDNTIVDKSSPVSVIGGFTDWCQISAGGRHNAAVRTNGTLWAWGYNSNGQLGNNTTASQSSPVSVVGGFTDWCQVSAGRYHTAAVRTNGTIWSWGAGDYGKLGDNSTGITKYSPVTIVGGFTDWCLVSAGGRHTAAVRTTGTLWTWGRNNFGQLGDVSVLDKASPVSVVGGFTDWCRVSVGELHTAAIRTNGTIWSWGYNLRGQLGNNTNICNRSPVSVVGGFTDWCQLSAGGYHNAAIRTNGTLWSWGMYNGGRLGDGTNSNKSSPVSVLGGFTDWCQVSAGQDNSHAIRTNGSLWTWGRASYGELGDNSSSGSKTSPVSVVGNATWSQVSTSGRGYHTAGITNTLSRGF